MNRALLLILPLLLMGCAQNVRMVTEGDLDLFQPMAVYYATNRNNTFDDNLNKRYGAERYPLTYGISTISIPANYPKAHMTSFLHWNMTLKRNPEKHLSVLSMDEYGEHEFFDILNQYPSDQALVFIHGFNTPFERANRITAKMAYDLNFTGPVILFSWPSLATTTRYPADEANLEWSQPDFEALLENLLTQTDLQLNLMAHSLGNRALTQGLIDVLENKPQWQSRIQAVILAAPDIDAGSFSRTIGPELTELQIPITLYVSANDIALKASKAIHGYPRAGDSGDSIVVMPGIDTVDASLADAEVFGHEYYYQGRHTIADLYQWLVQGLTAEQRTNLTRIDTNNGTYWQIQPTEFSQPILQ